MPTLQPDLSVFVSLERELRQTCPTLELRREEPMSQHTSFRIGGPVTLMALPYTQEDLIGAVQTALRLNITPFFLGNGTNLLVADTGYTGFVIQTTHCNVVQMHDGCIQAESGVLLSRLASFAMEYSLTGLEFAQGIPGTLGGAVVMNAGAYDGEIAQVLTRVMYLDAQGRRQRKTVSECAFAYRHSFFSDRNSLILEAELSLRPGDPAEIQAKMRDLAERRRSKQPLDQPSAGSTFRRPVGHFAAALIEQCGLKGLTVGGAQVSTRHAGFLVNKGGASCADVLELVRQVQTRVRDETGVQLELEIKTLGV